MVEIEKHVQRSANATFDHIHTLQTHLSAVDGKMDNIQEKLGANAALGVKMDAIQEKLDRLLQQQCKNTDYAPTPKGLQATNGKNVGTLSFHELSLFLVAKARF